MFIKLANSCVSSLSMSKLLVLPLIILEIQTALRPHLSGFPGLLSCSTSDILGWIIYCWREGGPVHCRMFSCTYPPLPTRYLWHLLPTPAAKNRSQALPSCSQGMKSLLSSILRTNDVRDDIFFLHCFLTIRGQLGT